MRVRPHIVDAALTGVGGLIGRIAVGRLAVAEIEQGQPRKRVHIGLLLRLRARVRPRGRHPPEEEVDPPVAERHRIGVEGSRSEPEPARGLAVGPRVRPGVDGRGRHAAGRIPARTAGRATGAARRAVVDAGRPGIAADVGDDILAAEGGGDRRRRAAAIGSDDGRVVAVVQRPEIDAGIRPHHRHGSRRSEYPPGIGRTADMLVVLRDDGSAVRVDDGPLRVAVEPVHRVEEQAVALRDDEDAIHGLVNAVFGLIEALRLPSPVIAGSVGVAALRGVGRQLREVAPGAPKRARGVLVALLRLLRRPFRRPRHIGIAGSAVAHIPWQELRVIPLSVLAGRRCGPVRRRAPDGVHHRLRPRPGRHHPVRSRAPCVFLRSAFDVGVDLIDFLAGRERVDRLPALVSSGEHIRPVPVVDHPGRLGPFDCPVAVPIPRIEVGPLGLPLARQVLPDLRFQLLPVRLRIEPLVELAAPGRIRVVPTERPRVADEIGEALIDALVGRGAPLVRGRLPKDRAVHLRPGASRGVVVVRGFDGGRDARAPIHDPVLLPGGVQDIARGLLLFRRRGRHVAVKAAGPEVALKPGRLRELLVDRLVVGRAPIPPRGRHRVCRPDLVLLRRRGDVAARVRSRVGEAVLILREVRRLPRCGVHPLPVDIGEVREFRGAGLRVAAVPGMADDVLRGVQPGLLHRAGCLRPKAGIGLPHPLRNDDFTRREMADLRIPGAALPRHGADGLAHRRGVVVADLATGRHLHGRALETKKAPLSRGQSGLGMWSEVSIGSRR